MLRQARSKLNMLCFNLRIAYEQKIERILTYILPMTYDVEDGANNCNTEGSDSRYPELVNLYRKSQV